MIYASEQHPDTIAALAELTKVAPQSKQASALTKVDR